jgi:hypothetical protein
MSSEEIQAADGNRLKTIAKLGNGSDHSGNHLKMFYFEGS